jgi:hypothetical protein
MNSFKDALKMINTGFDCGVILQIGSFYNDSEIIKYMIIDLGKKDWITVFDYENIQIQPNLKIGDKVQLFCKSNFNARWEKI